MDSTVDSKATPTAIELNVIDAMCSKLSETPGSRVPWIDLWYFLPDQVRSETGIRSPNAGQKYIYKLMRKHYPLFEARGCGTTKGADAPNKLGTPIAFALAPAVKPEVLQKKSNKIDFFISLRDNLRNDLLETNAHGSFIMERSLRLTGEIAMLEQFIADNNEPTMTLNEAVNAILKAIKSGQVLGENMIGDRVTILKQSVPPEWREHSKWSKLIEDLKTKHDVLQTGTRVSTIYYIRQANGQA